jgi:hypothetical protein
MANRKVIMIIIGSPGGLVEKRVRFHEIVVVVMAMMSRARKVGQ